MQAMVRECALGFAALGVKAGDRVAIFCGTRPEWTLVDAAALCAGAVVVPIYPTNAPEQCRHVLADSGASVVVCEHPEHVRIVRDIRDGLPDLRHVVALEAGAGETLGLDELRARGAGGDVARFRARLDAIDPGAPATIVYTSGTTGPPKGCVLTHRNLLSAVGMYTSVLDPGADEPMCVFLFLPLAHVLARVAVFVTIGLGGTVAYWGGDPKHLLEDVVAARPTHLPAVPRLLEKVRARVLVETDAGAVRRSAFRRALRVGLTVDAARVHGERVPLPERVRHAVADRLVLGRVRAVFGDRLRLVLTGAAPISVDVLRFFAACGIPVLEGYGLTETCAAATLVTPERGRRGTVGPVLPGVEMRIADHGEVLLRGPNVFTGYWKDPGATAAAVDPDHWLHTGDLGSIDDEGALTITGRTKEIIVTAGGKNVSPATIEAGLRESRWVSQAIVYGDGRPYVTALLTLDADQAPALADQLGIAPDIAAMATDPRVIAALEADVEAVNRRFSRVEQVKRFAILDHEFSATDELTPTLKVKRATVYRRYAETFDALYSSPRPPGGG
jgi:long-chain acyl-CoA synthetase